MSPKSNGDEVRVSQHNLLCNVSSGSDSCNSFVWDYWCLWDYSFFGCKAAIHDFPSELTEQLLLNWHVQDQTPVVQMRDCTCGILEPSIGHVTAP